MAETLEVGNRAERAEHRSERNGVTGGGRSAADRSGIGSLPIAVGIVGHRAMHEDDRKAIEERMRSVFRDLKSKYPHTPLMVLSPLAEGADRLGARIAMEFGAELVVPLPFERDLYIQDFEQPGSIEEFDTLLASASLQFVLPLLDGYTLDDIRRHGPARNEHYAQVGAFVARYSQIFIALWDGLAPKHTGGTAEVVQYRLEGIPERFVPPRTVLDALERGPVMQIVTPRPGHAPPDAPAADVLLHLPTDHRDAKEVAHQYNLILERIETFNHDDIRLSEQLAEARESSRRYLCPFSSRETLTPGLLGLLDRFSRADTMAIHFQSKTVRNLAAIFSLVFLAVLFFELFSHLFHHQLWLLGLYLGALGAAFVVYIRVDDGDYQTKYLDYRALAEGLRVQFFWGVAGIEDSAAEHYLRKQRSVLDWIRDSIRTWSLLAYSAGAFDPVEMAVHHTRLEVVMANWVDDQGAYFPRAAHKLERILHRLEIGVDFFFFLAIAVAVVQLALAGGPGINLGIGVLLVMAGLLHGYIDKRAFKQLSKQYERMAATFSTASERLRHYHAMGDEERIRAVLHALGTEALVENGDWVILHRDRPIEVPRGG